MNGNERNERSERKSREYEGGQGEEFDFQERWGGCGKKKNQEELNQEESWFGGQRKR